jgi:hypothetical protein
VDVPNYSSVEIMKEKFRTAILTCGEIDDDGNYYDSEDNEDNEDYEGGDGDSNEGEGE